LIKTKGKYNKKRTCIIIITILLTLIFIKKPLIEKIKKGKVKEVEVKKPEYKIAIIIDDVGYPSDNIDAFIKFKEKLTFSILPFLSESKRYANILKNSGFEIMIHIPMEPLDYPDVNPGKNAIFSFDTAKYIEDKMNDIILNISDAKGANNHMGSKATQDKELMYSVLKILKNNNMFFIDSLTTKDSCAYDVALKLNMKTAKRDIFLDNEDNFSYINIQFEKLKDIAKARGTAIGIGHFSKINTIKVLDYQLKMLKKQNFILIFASEATK